MDLPGHGLYDDALYEELSCADENSDYLHRGARLCAAQVLGQGAP
jgi:hypothetical protein